MHKGRKKQRNKDFQTTCSTILEKIHIYELFTIFCFQRFDFLFLCAIIVIPTLCANMLSNIKFFYFFLIFRWNTLLVMECMSTLTMNSWQKSWSGLLLNHICRCTGLPFVWSKLNFHFVFIFYNHIHNKI